MSGKKTSFSLFNKSKSSGRRSLQTILDDSNKPKDSNRSRFRRTSPLKNTITRSSSQENKSNGKKGLVFGSKKNIPKSSPKTFRSKFDIINQNQTRKQLVFGKQDKVSLSSEPTKFRKLIIDPKTSKNTSDNSYIPKKSKKKTQLEIFREQMNSIKGNDSWDLYEDPTISRFVLGTHVIEFKNLSPEQFKFYQSVVQKTNHSIDSHMRKLDQTKRENCDPKIKYQNRIIDRLWRNPDVPLNSWDYVIKIIDKLDYDYDKFIKLYINVSSEESHMINQLRNIKKKLKKIEQLETKKQENKNLNSDQLASIESKVEYLLKQSIYESWLEWMNTESDNEVEED